MGWRELTCEERTQDVTQQNEVYRQVVQPAQHQSYSVDDTSIHSRRKVLVSNPKEPSLKASLLHKFNSVQILKERRN